MPHSDATSRDDTHKQARFRLHTNVLLVQTVSVLRALPCLKALLLLLLLVIGRLTAGQS